MSPLSIAILFGMPTVLFLTIWHNIHKSTKRVPYYKNLQNRTPLTDFYERNTEVPKNQIMEMSEYIAKNYMRRMIK